MMMQKVTKILLSGLFFSSVVSAGEIEPTTMSEAQIMPSVQPLQAHAPIELASSKVGLLLAPVPFRSNSFAIEAEYRQQLEQWASLMKAQPQLQLTLGGYADARGDKEYNQRLSEKRVASVVELFIDEGIAPERILTAAYGESEAEASEHDSDGLFFERKVTLKLQALRSSAVKNAHVSL
jgi:outer membrane protein OmpA-like peptidoglycan-associated protein